MALRVACRRQGVRHEECPPEGEGCLRRARHGVILEIALMQTAGMVTTRVHTITMRHENYINSRARITAIVRRHPCPYSIHA